jgi:putative spermidine/putrescine transport system ATP-binding protein
MTQDGGRLLAAVPASSPVLPVQGASVRISFPRQALHVMEQA